MAETNLIKQETIDAVEKRVMEFKEKGELNLPENYSPNNALKSAWLILQETKDKANKPALSVCTRASVANSLLDMVVQGLNPAKKQCYFIVYGNQLVCMRSYFGTMAMVKRLYPQVADVVASTIHDGDNVTVTIDNGRKRVEKHIQKFGNEDNAIKGAYCVVLDKDNNIIRSEVMTIDQIKKAWAQSAIKPVDGDGNIKAGSTHDKFTTEMAKKTVINRCLKTMLNSSDDSDLVIQALNRADEIRTDDAVDAEIEENANTGDVIDIMPVPGEDQPQEQPEPTEQDIQDGILKKLNAYIQLDSDAFEKALEKTGFMDTPLGNIGETDFTKISKEFNELLDQGNQETGKDEPEF